ncbi:MAG: arginyltransferase [Pseudomonadota bacterium]
MDVRTVPLKFFATPPHSCSYLPNREAVTVFADPRSSMNPSTYSRLIDGGFRRSGEYVYCPDCRDCNACVSARIPVVGFTPNRTQRRTWRNNADINVVVTDARFSREHYALYQRYIHWRHAGGGMDEVDPNKYRSFLESTWCATWLVEFRLNNTLLAVACTDVLDQGLSAVYTFYAPEHAKRGLGVLAVMWQIQEARRLGLLWVYLGYWIEDCEKMNYKTQYQPLEILTPQGWQAREAPV